MPFFLWTLTSLAAYALGLFLILRMTSLLLVYRFDEGPFMGIAALDLIGGILAFAAVVITLAIFNGEIAIRALDFLLLGGIVFIGGWVALRSFRSRLVKRVPLSCALSGTYGLILCISALYYMILLFR